MPSDHEALSGALSEALTYTDIKKQGLTLSTRRLVLKKTVFLRGRVR